MAYLTVDEQATYVDVLCDGYTVRIYKTSTNSYFGDVYISGTREMYLYSAIRSGSTFYNTGMADPKTVELLENTSTRVQVRITGIYRSSTPADLTGCDAVTTVLTFYADRFIHNTQIEANVTGITVDGYLYCAGRISMIDSNPMANEDGIMESSGSEVDMAVNQYHDSAKYCGIIGDEATYIGVVLAGSGTIRQFANGSDAGPIFGWNDVTLAEGAHDLQVMWIIDSAERTGSAKLYNSADRLAMGDQYKDLEI